MNYKYKEYFKNGKIFNNSYFSSIQVFPIVEIELPYTSSSGVGTLEIGKCCHISNFNNGHYEILGHPKNDIYSSRYFDVTEDILNKFFICWCDSLLYEDKHKGLVIYKGLKTVYQSKSTKLKLPNSYRIIDIFLKRMFLYDEAITKCFMGKTLEVVKQLQETIKTATKMETEQCIKSVAEYLATTLASMDEISQKTDLTNPKNVREIVKQTKAQKFIEEMKLRNQIATEFLNS